jgi:hypothetical protein
MLPVKKKKGKKNQHCCHWKNVNYNYSKKPFHTYLKKKKKQELLLGM